jgi:hypothetical protein
MPARISAAIIAFDHLRGNDFQILRIIVHRAAEFHLPGGSPGGIALFYGGFGLESAHIRVQHYPRTEFGNSILPDNREPKTDVPLIAFNTAATND